MGENERLNRRQRRFVAALLVSPTIEQAAQVAGIAPSTAYRYLREPAVKAELGQALDGALGQAARQVVAEMGAALETLEAIHQDSEAPASARVSAARTILQAGPALREALDLAERVTALEQKLLSGGDDK